MPSISNKMRPGTTDATKYATSPFPAHMVTSGGFLVKGLSGKIRIQNLPIFRVARANITRHDSISRSFIQPVDITLYPKLPKERFCPLTAIFLQIPLNCFRYFCLLGANIYVYLQSQTLTPIYPDFVRAGYRAKSTSS